MLSSFLCLDIVSWTHFLDFADWIRVLSMLKFSSEGQDTLPVSLVIELPCRCMSFFFFFAGFLWGLHWASSGYSTEVHNYLLSSSRLEAVYISLTFSLGRRKLLVRGSLDLIRTTKERSRSVRSFEVIQQHLQNPSAATSCSVLNWKEGENPEKPSLRLRPPHHPSKFCTILKTHLKPHLHFISFFRFLLSVVNA